MKKLLLFTLFFISNLSFAQDKKQAINDFLHTIIPDYNKKIFVIKEKTNVNHVIDIFKGKTSKDSITNEYKRDEREEIKPPLYNEADWARMKKKYYHKTEENTAADNLWLSTDFDYKHIEFFSSHLFIEFIVGHSEQHRPITNIFSFSEPIYYSGKKYLVFKVGQGTTESINGLTDNYLIIMKKENGKWVVINKSYQLDVFY
ncbi:hypothetical protein [Flavobacterium sp. Root420]|uniref:hypothetical protein n=1 Tax=Flavobacterium sp. Root420 TaxID=1736533 RepID=UPI0006FD35EB|nr:hypothetical protein [Flavobacterium sp. Root420]KQX10984.1 hypothetical protein ASC72_21175 [Flavobacterium sp. Root420]